MQAFSNSSYKWTAGAALALTLSLIGAENPSAVAGQSTQLNLLNIVYPPNSLPAAKPYRTHAANWEKWALTQPADKSPLLDTTGQFCSQGQPNLLSGVWYLAGTFFSETPVTRTCTVPQNRVIIFPVVEAGYGAFPSDPPAERTVAFVREQAAAAFGQPTNVSASIDGVAINVPPYLVESDVTSFTLPPNSIFGNTDPQPLNPFASKGYFIALRLDPLSFVVGSTHTLKFKGTVTGLGTVDVTYKLKVGFPG